MIPDERNGNNMIGPFNPSEGHYQRFHLEQEERKKVSQRKSSFPLFRHLEKNDFDDQTKKPKNETYFYF